MSHRTARRRRKKRRERLDSPPALPAPHEARGGRAGDIAFYTEPELVLSDLQLVRRAVRNDWSVEEPMRAWLADSTMRIVMGQGNHDADEVTEAFQSISACQTMLEMVAANIRDERRNGFR